MATFIEYYQFNETTKGYETILGSDGVAYLDGRFGRARQHIEAQQIATSRKAVKKIDGYRIARVSHTRPFYLTASVIPIKQ